MSFTNRVYSWIPIVGLLLSSAAIAQQDLDETIPESNLYIGFELVPQSSYSYSHHTGSGSRDLSTGWAINLGYQQYFSRSFSLTTEIEFQYLGSIGTNKNNSSLENQWVAGVAAVKPAFHIPNTDAYIAGLAGFSNHTVNVDQTDNGMRYMDYTAEPSLTLGLETGYQFDLLDIYLGYTWSTLLEDFDQGDIDLDHISVGLRYKF